MCYPSSYSTAPTSPSVIEPSTEPISINVSSSQIVQNLLSGILSKIQSIRSSPLVEGRSQIPRSDSFLASTRKSLFQTPIKQRLSLFSLDEHLQHLHEKVVDLANEIENSESRVSQQDFDTARHALAQVESSLAHINGSLEDIDEVQLHRDLDALYDRLERVEEKYSTESPRSPPVQPLDDSGFKRSFKFLEFSSPKSPEYKLARYLAEKRKELREISTMFLTPVWIQDEDDETLMKYFESTNPNLAEIVACVYSGKELLLNIDSFRINDLDPVTSPELFERLVDMHRDSTSDEVENLIARVVLSYNSKRLVEKFESLCREVENRYSASTNVKRTYEPAVIRLGIPPKPNKSSGVPSIIQSNIRPRSSVFGSSDTARMIRHGANRVAEKRHIPPASTSSQ